MNKVLRATLIGAVVITTVIGIASFVLSFAALWDLATMAGVPRNLSWLWPVIVDGTILQATISVIALAGFEEQRAGRRFFWWVLVIAALVSIGANALHAFIAQAGSLHPALSAAIATVAPISLLAATHGLGILVRIPTPPAEQVEHADAAVAAGHSGSGSAGAVVAGVGAGISGSGISGSGASGVAVEPMPMASAVAGYGGGGVDVLGSHAIGGGVGDPVDRSVVGAGAAGSSVSSGDQVREAGAHSAEPLDEVDRWILDEDRIEDLYPVDAP